MNWSRSIVCVSLLLFTAGVIADTATGGSERESRDSVVFPGLYEPDGTPHPLHSPNPVTGRTVNVLDFGADSSDNATDDRPAVEAALNSAVPGDELYFPAGVYNFYSSQPGDKTSHVTGKSGVNWRGEQRDRTILRSEYSDITIDRFLKMRGLHDILISNLTFTARFLGRYSTDTEINNPDAAGPKYVISIEDNNGWPSYNITVDSVLVENYRIHGVRLSNSHDVVIRHSTFWKTTDVAGGGAGYGVSIQGNSLPDNLSKFNVVEYCSFLGPYVRHGILLQYATHNNAVRYNLCDNTRLDAIDLHGEDEYLNEIYENRVQNVPAGAGAGVGNTGATHDMSGPFNFIHHNQFVNCREGVKVYLGSPDTRIEDNIITGSSVSSGKGIYILNGPRTIVRGNEIHDNTGASFAGIVLQYDNGENGRNYGPPQDVRILENNIYNNPYGVRLFAGERIIYEGNNVHDNRIANFSAAAAVSLYKWLQTSTTGAGTIELDPAGGSYPAGTVVLATARPMANWRFDRWEGDLAGTLNPQPVTLDSSKQIAALFVEKNGSDEVNLNLTVEGNGTVILDPPGGVYARGSLVKVRAAADAGWQFSHWSGDLTSAFTVDSLIVDTDKQITAHFELLPSYKVVFWIVGSGSIQLDPPGGSYPAGTRVIVTAVPAAGWQFKNWDGSLKGSRNPDTLVIAADEAVMAVFAQGNGVELLGQAGDYRLQQNYPNPFNATTAVSFGLTTTSRARLAIANSLGVTVRTLLDQTLTAGPYRISWDGKDDAGRDVSAGVYFCQLITEGGERRIKMLLLR
jgi:hypothetical protein